jgi:hypothetical protein
MIGTYTDWVMDVTDHGDIQQRRSRIIFRNENVCRLDVTVTKIVRGTQENGRFGYFVNDAAYFVAWHNRKLFFQFDARRAAHQEKQPVVELAAVVDLDQRGARVTPQGQLLINPLSLDLPFRPR